MPNPFSNLIVSDPRKIARSIDALNAKPLDQLIMAFKELTTEPLPRLSIEHQRAILVTSPSPGYGKSHLIGRLFHKLEGQATLIYIRPYLSPGGAWQSILRQTILEMDYPDRAATGSGGASGPRQLESFAQGVLAHLVAGGIEARHIPCEQVEATAAYLRENPQRAFDRSLPGNPGADWMYQHVPDAIQILADQIRAHGLHFNSASRKCWLNVLHHLSFKDLRDKSQEVLMDWLCGRSISGQEAATIGIPVNDQPSQDMSAADWEDLSLRRLLDLSKLAGFYRLFVHCFDQTENYGGTPELAESLGRTIADLVNTAPNTLIVITANLDPWTRRLLPHIQEADAQKIRKPWLELEGLNQRQAEELLAQRMEGWAGSPGTAPDKIRTWLDGLFADHPKIGIREFLQEAGGSWEAAPPPAVKSLEEVYQEYVISAKSRQNSLAFNPDVFEWLVRDVGAKIREITVEACNPPTKYFKTLWRENDRTFLFAFEGGSHWKRWQAISESSDIQHRADRKAATTGVLFRTAELPVIPRPGWAFAKQMAEAMRRHLFIVNLTAANTASMYACRNMYTDASDLGWPADEILEFTAVKLRDWWRRLLATHLSGHDPSDAVAPATSPTDVSMLLDAFMRRQKFASLSDIAKNLGSACAEEEILRAGGENPRITIYPSSGKTVFLWH